jgi:serine/threonine-protein kinase
MTRTPVAQQLLRAHLAAGAADRERFVIRVFLLLTIVSLAAVVGFATDEHRRDIMANVPLFAPPLVVQALVFVALGRGWFHPVVPWLDAAIQTSMIAVPYWFAVQHEGAGFAVGSPMVVGWILVVMVSALRASPTISIACGAIAAAEYLMLTLVALDALSARERGEVITEAGLFVVAGLGAGATARYVVGQAESALRAVREQDLMSKYLVHEKLGAGGMAEVFRATYSPEGGFEKVVAIKRMLPEIAATADAGLLHEMFRDEAQLCARLSHGNVIQVLDAGRFAGRYVVAMEYVDGVPLSRVLQAGPLPLCAIAFATAEIAAALDYIHTRVDDDGASLHLVHRDVNPPNVLVSRRGEVKLADFGIAHALGRASHGSDRVFGKPGYLAPEQLRPGELDGRADLFALGLTMYEMIVGQPMFRGRALEEVEDFRMPDAELAASPRGSDLPAELRQLAVALLALRPDDRPASGAIVRARLLAIAGAAAPFPNGQGELARAVRAAQGGDTEPRVPTAATVRAS